ncbi:MAG: DNA repair protein RadC [Blastomonas sp.]
MSSRNQLAPNSPEREQADASGQGSGHRARLRQRILNSDETGLHDHEIIEYLLALAIPRRDTKPLAKELIRRFGGFGGVMMADGDSLMAVDGMGETSAAAIKIVRRAAVELLRKPLGGQTILSNWQALLDYLRADMAHLKIERVRVLYLSSKNVLMSDEHMGDGSVDQAAIYTRQVIKRALDLGATGLILVHNHPSGNPQPSKQDIAITRDIIDAGRRLGITVHDHVIIGLKDHHSMRSAGLI